VTFIHPHADSGLSVLPIIGPWHHHRPLTNASSVRPPDAAVAASIRGGWHGADSAPLNSKL
jgi:hypothetical protein